MHFQVDTQRTHVTVCVSTDISKDVVVKEIDTAEFFDKDKETYVVFLGERETSEFSSSPKHSFS